MNTHKQPTEIENIACEICHNEMPHSETHNAEVDDYVMNFCGLECYDKWKEKEEPKE